MLILNMDTIRRRSNKRLNKIILQHADGYTGSSFQSSIANIITAFLLGEPPFNVGDVLADYHWFLDCPLPKNYRRHGGIFYVERVTPKCVYLRDLRNNSQGMTKIFIAHVPYVNTYSLFSPWVHQCVKFDYSKDIIDIICFEAQHNQRLMNPSQIDKRYHECRERSKKTGFMSL